MRSFIRLILVAVVPSLSLLAISAYGGEEDISLDQVPKAVMDTAKARFHGAELIGAAKETETDKGDEIVYEISLKHKGQRFDALFTKEGAMFLYEAQITAKDLPTAVAKTLAKKYPKATYKLYEQLYKVKDKKESLDCYEMQLVTADTKKVMEVKVAEDGKILEEKEATPE